MGTIWTYENVAIGLIYDEWKECFTGGLSSWDILRKLRSIGVECSIDQINFALHEYERSQLLMIVENTVVPFRFALTAEGLSVAQKVQRELELFKQKRLAARS